MNSNIDVDHPERGEQLAHEPIPRFLRRTGNLDEQLPPAIETHTLSTEEVRDIHKHGGGLNPQGDPLAELSRLISEPPRVPAIAGAASAGMREGFERVAQEIVAVAEDGVARAQQNLQEAKSFASLILKSGDLLCSTIESEGVRILHVSRIMRDVRSALGGPPPSPEGG